MTQDRLRELLARVRQHLKAGSAMDADARRELGGVTGDLERSLGASDQHPSGAAPRLESLAVRFEAGHPALAETLREIIDALATAGI